MISTLDYKHVAILAVVLVLNEIYNVSDYKPPDTELVMYFMFNLLEYAQRPVMFIW